MNNVFFEKGKRKAIIKESRFGGFTVFFYYDGFYDYEWKRCSHGIPCDTCKTLASAKAKAKRYINKD